MASEGQTTTARSGAGLRFLVITLTAFFTVVDLFATQAILPILAHAYRVAPAAVGVAVNASTFGMACAGLLVALFSARIDRRKGILISLVVLAVPTTLLAFAPNLAVFALLRVAQGLCMSTAFSLTLTYLGEHSSPADHASAFAAYITGNVASNLVGRLIAATVAQSFGLATNFFLFAGLNLAGAVLVYFTIQRTPKMASMGPIAPMRLVARIAALAKPALLSGFGVGFCILFAFIGVFTYVNFVLVRPPLALGMMSVGVVYFVFAPSIVITPAAGLVVRRAGVRPALWLGLGAAAAGLPLLLSPILALVLLGMTVVGAGTFFAQAVATSFVSGAASDRGAASGVYLAAYFSGGLIGSAVLGQAFDRLGWPACVAGVGVALAAAAALGVNLRAPAPAVT
jgi:predicted MFS family arabinose efflux permease